MVKAMGKERGVLLRKVSVSVGGILMIGFLCGVLDSRAATASKHFTVKEREAQALVGASIRGIAVSNPVKRLLLMRRGSDLCAIRFTEFHRGHDAKPQTWFHSGHENFYADYEWYWPGPNGDFPGSDLATGHRTLRRGAIVGLLFLNLGFPLGTDDVECGPFDSRWSYPTGINFIEGSRYDYDLELAPTQWTEPSQINLQDPKLKWYRLNEDQPDTFIPLNKLPSLPNNGAYGKEKKE